MKATIEIPDDLYRRVKAKSALQGQPIREVAMHLFLNWIEAPDDSLNREPRKDADLRPPAWFGAAQKYARQTSEHDMESIRRSIARGRAGTTTASAPGKRHS